MLYKLYCRVYQRILQGVSYLLPWRRPELFEGEDSFSEMAKQVKTKGIGQVLIVTGPHISAMGLMNGMLSALSSVGISYSVYDKTVANPTSDNVEEAYSLYKANKCEGIIAFGGGSPMDCAKGVGARVANPKKSLLQMKGLLKVRKSLPMFIAVPTTAGTGSETTVAAVISDGSTHVKYQVNDIVLMPQYAVLDPTLTTGLPPKVTSTTGMDALTHAIEAYIGKSNTKETKEFGRKAVKIIFDNIFTAYSNGENLVARMNMLEASHFAGIAFTRAYVGYVHGIAHALGGMYGFPHGLAIAVILPHTLSYYGSSVHESLAELADEVGIGAEQTTIEGKANAFIEAIRALNQSMDIPNKLAGTKESDLPKLVKLILKESNPLYPVPKILLQEEMTELVRSVME